MRNTALFRFTVSSPGSDVISDYHELERFLYRYTPVDYILEYIAAHHPTAPKDSVIDLQRISE